MGLPVKEDESHFAHRKFFLSRSYESTRAASKSVKLGDAPRQPSGPFAHVKQEIMSGMMNCFSRCRGFAVADLAPIFPGALRDSFDLFQRAGWARKGRR